MNCPDTSKPHPPGRARMAKRTGSVRLPQGVKGDLVADSFKVSVFKLGVSFAGFEYGILQRDGWIGFHDGGTVFLEERAKHVRDVDQAGVVDRFVRSFHVDGR